MLCSSRRASWNWNGPPPAFATESFSSCKTSGSQPHWWHPRDFSFSPFLWPRLNPCSLSASLPCAGSSWTGYCSFRAVWRSAISESGVWRKVKIQLNHPAGSCGSYSIFAPPLEKKGSPGEAVNKNSSVWVHAAWPSTSHPKMLMHVRGVSSRRRSRPTPELPLRFELSWELWLVSYILCI